MNQARPGSRSSWGFCLRVLSLGAPAQAPGGRQKQEPTFRVNVRLVNVFATVTDGRGAPVAGLTKDDFRVFEDGVPQNISVFDQESELPLSIALAVDTSASTQHDLKP